MINNFHVVVIFIIEYIKFTIYCNCFSGPCWKAFYYTVYRCVSLSSFLAGLLFIAVVFSSPCWNASYSTIYNRAIDRMNLTSLLFIATSFCGSMLESILFYC